MIRENVIGGFVLVAVMALFVAFVMPVAIDKELHRQEAVREWNLEHGYGP